MVTEHDLLTNTVNILPENLSVTTDRVSPVRNKKRKNKIDIDDKSKFPKEIIEGFIGISRASKSEEANNIDQRILRTENRVEEYLNKVRETEDPGLLRFYEERLRKAEEMLEQANYDYEKFHK